MTAIVQADSGTIVEVRTVTLGDELAVDHAAGATVLTVSDVVDFSDGGGTLTIGTETIDYTTAVDDEDNDVGLITLATPLASAYLAGERVVLDPPSYEKYAQVMIGDFDEAVEARIGHTLWDRVADGIRPDGQGEVVTLDLVGDEFVVADVLGSAPLVDGSYLDPTIPLDPALVPPGTTSDGNPPDSSPAAVVAGGLESLFVQWDPVANADPVTYAVHVSATTPVAVDATTLVTSTPATLAVTNTLADGSPVVAGTTYHAVLVASDADGSAAPGLEGSGVPQAAVDQAALDTLNNDLHGPGGLDEQLAATNSEVDAILPITSAKLADGAVLGTKLADLAVTVAKIADGAVANAKLVDGAVSAAKVATDAITETKISADAVTSPKIATNAVTASEIQAGAVVAGKIATDAVTANTIEANAVTTAKINAGAVVAGSLATDAVTAVKIQAGAVVAGKIATDAVTANTIAAGAVVAGKIAADAVTANTIAAGQVTAGKIGADAVAATNIAADAVLARNIKAGEITAAKIAADALDGKTITGPLIRTSATGNRLEITNADELRFYSGLASEAVYGQITAWAGPSSGSVQIASPAPDDTSLAERAFVEVWGPGGGYVSNISLRAGVLTLGTDQVYLDGEFTDGSVGTGTFRDSVDARVTALSLDQTEVDARVSAVAPTVTMTTGGVGTGAFRTSVRDAVKGDYAQAWTAYTPTFTATTTNPTLANFTRTGRYIQRGKTVTFTAVITCNTASGLGSGNYEFGLPVPALDTVIVTANQEVPNLGYTGRAGGSTTTVALYRTDTNARANPANSSVAAGTVFRITGTYEAA